MSHIFGTRAFLGYPEFMLSISKELRYGQRFIEFISLNVLGHVFLFALPLLIARLLAPEIFGAYSLSMLVAYLFSALLLASTLNPFVVVATEELRARQRINTTLSAWLVILAGSVGLFALLSAVFVQPLTQFAAINVSQLGFLFLAFTGIALRRALGATFIVLGMKRAHTAVEIIFGTLSIGYLLAVHFLFGITLERIFLVLFAAPLTTLLIMFRHLDRAKIFPFVFERPIFNNLLGHMKWTVLGGAAMYLFNWGDNLVLRYFVPLNEIGSYNLGYQMFKGTTFLLVSVRTYFTPFLVMHAREPGKVRHFLSHKRVRIMAAGAVAIVIMMAAFPFLIRTFYGETYRAAIPVVLVLLASSFFILHRMFYEAILNARKQYRFTQLATICFVALNIGLDIPLVMRFGVMGAAIATSVTYIAYAAAFEVYYRRYLKRELTGSAG